MCHAAIFNASLLEDIGIPGPWYLNGSLDRNGLSLFSEKKLVSEHRLKSNPSLCVKHDLVLK